MTDTIKLHDVEGISRKTATDEHGNQWTEFTVDYLALEEDGECSICGAFLGCGWMCLDGGEEVCEHHVEFV